MQLQATLRVPYSVLDLAIREEERHNGLNNFLFSDAGDGVHIVRGPAQGIMFLIGFIASQGEDGLLSVVQISEKRLTLPSSNVELPATFA